MTNPYTIKDPYGDGDYDGPNSQAVRAIRDQACRTGGEFDDLLMTKAEADALLAGYEGPSGSAIEEVEAATNEAMWHGLGNFLTGSPDPDDAEAEEQILRALEGPVLDAMVAAATRDVISQATYDALSSHWLQFTINGGTNQTREDSP